MVFFNVSLDNKSTREIDAISVSIIQNTQFHANSPYKKTKTELRTIATLYYPETIEPQSIVNWNNVSFEIPPIIASSNGTCKSIEVSYYLMFHVDEGAFSFALRLEIPIVIGTMPIMNNNATETEPVYQTSMLDQNVVTKAISDFESNGEMYGHNDYKPIYPYYKNITKIYSGNSNFSTTTNNIDPNILRQWVSKVNAFSSEYDKVF